MNRILSYSGIAAKIRAMHSRLLTKEQFYDLAGCSTVSEAASYLKRHPGYLDTLAALDESSSMHRSDVEQYLRQSVLKDFSRIYHFCNLKQRQFLDLYVIRYEISLIKQCLRTVCNGRAISVADDTGMWFYEDHFPFDVKKLDSVSTLGALIECLRGSGCYNVLAGMYHGSEKESSLFDYETALDLFYFSATWKAINKLFTGKEKQAFLAAYGAKIDILNIQWIYRFKTYYSMSPADIRRLIIPVYYRLKKTAADAMAEAESPDTLAELIRATRYGAQFEEESPAVLEQIYRSVLNSVHKVSLRRFPYSMVCVDSYLYHKEEEVDLITTVIEGIRYGLTYDELARYIV